MVRSVVMLALLSSFSICHAYQLEPIKEGLFRFVDGRHRSMVWVGQYGVLIIDPLNPKAAEWLKAKIKKTFDKPIRYVIYSHNHSDHIYGGELLQSSQTTFIAHELVKEDILSTGAKAVVPDVTFKKKLSVVMDGQHLDLRYHGPNDGRGSISMHFREKKVLFIVDWALIGRMPWKGLWSYDVPGVIKSVEEVLALDFDIFVGGHADVGDKSGLAHYKNYLMDLSNSVVKGIQENKSLEDLQKSIRLDQYKDLRMYNEWLPLNIAGVYKGLMETSGMSWRPEVLISD